MRSSRRTFLSSLATTTAGACFVRALAAEGSGSAKVTPEMIAKAEWISGLTLSKEQRKLLVSGADELERAFKALRAVAIDNGISPALVFQPLVPPPPGKAQLAVSALPATARPAKDSDLAFLSVQDLAALIHKKEISSTELTKFYLARIEKHDPKLLAVITRTEELALQQAAQADAEIAKGNWRGPLHGIPYGAKDLLAVPGYPTTWGAGPYKTQTRPEKATVVSKLEAAGAVLLAKTTLGELAMDDEWFGGTTRNPWKLDQGSSGSSAGSASCVAAGLMGFAIGSETWGSLVSPSTRCGTSALRPTFGAVSRYGAMALSWSMDKLGPIARRVEDLALIHAAIAGADGLDAAAKDAGFIWRSDLDVRGMRVGVLQDLFDVDYATLAGPGEDKQAFREWQKNDLAALEMLRTLEIGLVPVKLPVTLPVTAMATILTAEAACAFDELTRSGADTGLKRQSGGAWPNIFRQGQLIPAVEYLRANRVRRMVMQQMETLMDEYPVLVAPSFGGDMLLLTNLTGHPQVVVPNGFRSDGTPTSLTFTGRLWGEPALLALAREYQEGTNHHMKHPPLFLD